MPHWNINIPVITLEQSPEWTRMEWHRNAWLEWMLKIAEYGKFCKFTQKIVIKSDKKLGMVLIIGDDVGALTTWSVRISKYSN